MYWSTHPGYEQRHPTASEDTAILALVRRVKKGSKLWGGSSVAQLDRKEKLLKQMLDAFPPAGLMVSEAGTGPRPLHTVLAFRKLLYS